ncbi:hypothetical protein BKA69DRAFT_916621 [Paraphysoderma sedebokerense]|nr:hypothetical protein BKA69DRAFT_916621 [Paraphysoderma sedebokerense]
MIVEGVMKVGEKIVNQKLLYSDLRRRKRLNDKDTAWKQRIHSVIFVIPQQYAADSDQQQDLIQPYVAMYEKLRNELKRKAIVAVSQFDKVGQENGRLVLQQIADSFNIPVDQVYPLINYSSGMAKNSKLFEMDQRTIHILYAALQGASNFMRVEALGQVERLFDYDDDDLSYQFQHQVNLDSSSSSQGSASNVASTTELMEEIWTFMMDLVNEDLIEPEDFEALKNANEGKLRSIYKSAMKGASEDDKIYRFLRGAKQFQLL